MLCRLLLFRVVGWIWLSRGRSSGPFLKAGACKGLALSRLVLLTLHSPVRRRCTQPWLVWPSGCSCLGRKMQSAFTLLVLGSRFARKMLCGANSCSAGDWVRRLKVCRCLVITTYIKTLWWEGALVQMSLRPVGLNGKKVSG